MDKQKFTLPYKIYNMKAAENVSQSQSNVLAPL